MPHDERRHVASTSVRRLLRARRWAVAGIAWVALLGCGTSQPGAARDDAAAPVGPALPDGLVGHSGRWLTDAEGRVLLFHGVNMVEKDAPYTPASGGFSDADAAWLADNGFRAVRVGVLATGLMPTPGVVDTGYIAQIATTVSDLAKYQIYSLLDFHQDGWGPVVGSDGFPAWMTLTGDAVNNQDAGFPLYYENNPALQQAFQSFWNDVNGPGDAGLQESYAAMFGAVAKQFAREPYVLGYDLFNEPWPGTTWSDCLNDAAGCPALDVNELAPAYAKAVSAIRAAGDTHLIFGEPFVLFNFGESATNIPLPGEDPNAGLSFHVYPLLPTMAPNVIDQAVAWTGRTGGALLSTEWGASTDTDLLTEQSVALDEALVPWMFWSFCCELVPSLGTAPGGGNLVGSTASVLIRPHPLAVAGTPQTLSVDPTVPNLQFTWSTARAGGGNFAPGTVTSFEVPALAYPKGYKATVTNGVVTSAACAPVLTVLATGGAQSVTVDVEPGGKCE